MVITLEQVLKAYDYANSHPHKYLRGTTNWCAAVAHSLNAEQPAPVVVVMAGQLNTCCDPGCPYRGEPKCCRELVEARNRVKP